MSLGFGSHATFQFYRTERWLGRLEAIYSGKFKPVGNFDDTLDYVLAFFINCHHIKDWLTNGQEWQDDVDSSVKARAIEQFVSESEALKICADLCNGNKHFRFDRDLRSGTPPTFRSEHTKIDMTRDIPVKTTRYTLNTVRGEIDAYLLAEECTKLWGKFIRESTAASLETLASRNTRSTTRRTFVCPGCRQSAQAKPDTALVCGSCFDDGQVRIMVATGR